jgi:hypothetical protein
MMRALEFLVALVIVAALGVLAAVVMPGSGHVDRSLDVGKDLRQVYDVLDNFHRFPDYSVLRTLDSSVDFTFSGKAYGPGAEISWSANDPKVGDGGLTIASATPNFDKIDSNTKSAASSGIWTTAGAVNGQALHAGPGAQGQPRAADQGQVVV